MQRPGSEGLAFPHPFRNPFGYLRRGDGISIEELSGEASGDTQILPHIRRQGILVFGTRHFLLWPANVEREPTHPTPDFFGETVGARGKEKGRGIKPEILTHLRPPSYPRNNPVGLLH